MINEVTLVFPHQLFLKNPALKKDRTVILFEDERFFSDFNYHKQKLILHRASMKWFESELKKKGFRVIYLILKSRAKLFDYLKGKKIKTIHINDVVDHLLAKDLKRLCKKFQMNIISYDNPGFLCNEEYIRTYFAKKKRFFMTPFYIAQRKRLDILITKDKKPVGGQWTFDAENRERLPEDIKIPPIKKLRKNKFVAEALRYVAQNFDKNYGEYEKFIYPVTHLQARSFLKHFLEKSFKNFGAYQDAMSVKSGFLFHSILSSSLNIGLLTPHEVVKKSLLYAKKHKIPLNSVEGFIRQIIGWREFMRAVYLLKGEKERSSNFFKHKRFVPQSFWKGSTGIFPIDFVIKKVLQNAYCHHIERLMVLGNFMLLCEFKPDDVYRWFMELFIDAYDWVMVPNVYGMSQFADGGLFATKPYISSSKYIKKMSDFESGSWEDVWDALYWNFIHKNKKFFMGNPRLAMMPRVFTKMDKKKQQSLLSQARSFLEDF